MPLSPLAQHDTRVHLFFLKPLPLNKETFWLSIPITNLGEARSSFIVDSTDLRKIQIGFRNILLPKGFHWQPLAEAIWMSFYSCDVMDICFFSFLLNPFEVKHTFTSLEYTELLLYTDFRGDEYQIQQKDNPLLQAYVIE